MDDVDPGAVLCAAFLAQLPVDGVSVCVVSTGGARSTVGASGTVAAEVEELQLRLGEGPIQDALRTGLPVLAPDLTAERVHADWPVFAPAAERAGAGALFALPMFLGVVPVGVVSLLVVAAVPPWGDELLRTARALAAAAAAPAIGLATRSAIAERAPGDLQAELRREVHQAAGMVMVQLDVDIDEAMARLRARAFAEDRPIDVIARAVVAGASALSVGDD